MTQRLSSAGTVKSGLSVREKDREKKRENRAAKHAEITGHCEFPLTFVLPMAALNLILFPQSFQTRLLVGLPRDAPADDQNLQNVPELSGNLALGLRASQSRLLLSPSPGQGAPRAPL